MAYFKILRQKSRNRYSSGFYSTQGQDAFSLPLHRDRIPRYTQPSIQWTLVTTLSVVKPLTAGNLLLDYHLMAR